MDTQYTFVKISFSEKTKSNLALIFITGLALVLLATHVAHALAGNEGLATFGYGIVMPIGVALTLLGGTVWLRGSDIGEDYIIRVAVWCVLGTLVVGLGSVFMVLYEQSHGVALVDEHYLIVNAATGGSLVGFVVGVYESRTRVARERAAASRDRTERLNRRLSVLNRILRHDIRNSANVITARADLLEEGHSDAEANAEVIRRRAQNLSKIGEKARWAQQLVTDDTEHQAIDVSSLVAEQLDRYRQQYPEAEIDATVPDGLSIHASPLVTSALTNILDNAIEHNDKDTPRVDVSVATVPADGTEVVELAVADNGPGIPDEQLAVLERGYETSLKHTNGLGLWVVNWIVTESGGEIRFEENDPEGSRVCLRFPKEPHEDGPDTVRPLDLDVGASLPIVQQVSRQ